MIKINREPAIINYREIDELPEYYKFEGVNIEDNQITDWIEEAIKYLLRNEKETHVEISSGNTIVFAVRYPNSDNPDEDEILVRICKNYEEINFCVKDLEIL